MQNTGVSLKQYHFTKFCVAILISTENMCFLHCKRWSKTSEMHEANYSDKGLSNYVLCIIAQLDFSNCCLCLMKLSSLLYPTHQLLKHQLPITMSSQSHPSFSFFSLLLNQYQPLKQNTPNKHFPSSNLQTFIHKPCTLHFFTKFNNYLTICSPLKHKLTINQFKQSNL